MLLNIQNISKFLNQLSNCSICPHECRIDRTVSNNGKCSSSHKIKISSYGPHFGEEPELVGFTGSGTIFFSGCNLLCKFCQNYSISHLNEGDYVDESQLADIMIQMQNNLLTNINLVTPTHYAPQILKAIIIAKERGLNIPIVYNTNGYDSIETLKFFEGIVDIYMPDLKFVRPEICKLYTNAEDYFEKASKAIIEMHRQVGNLVVENEIAQKGLIIRHLILPNNQSDTYQIIDFISDNFGNDTYLNLMEQYHPCFLANSYKQISRRLSISEYNEYLDYARKKGFRRPDYIYS